MPHRVVFVRRAQRQLNAQIAYLVDRNPAAARRLSQAVESAGRQLADHPRSGPPGAIPGLRRLLVGPFVLTYRIRGTEVEVLDFRHARQAPLPPADIPQG
jgi:toxin ParE1/3/4